MAPAVALFVFFAMWLPVGSNELCVHIPHCALEETSELGSALLQQSTKNMLRAGSCYDSLLPISYGGPESGKLSLQQLGRSAVNNAGAFRMGALLNNLQSKRPIRIGIIGGSVEEGFQVPLNSPLWHTVFVDWLKKKYDHPDITARVFSMEGNYEFKGFNGWNETIATKVLQRGPFDLVMIQGAVNFPFHSQRHPPFVKDISVRRKYEERVLRELLEAVNGPALLLVEWMNACQKEIKTLSDFESQSCMSYAYGTWQDESTTFLAKLYEVSMVSARDALLHSTLLHTGQGAALGRRFTKSQIFADGLHPTLLGHQVFAQIVSFFMCQQLDNQQQFLKSDPDAYSRHEEQLPLPEFENVAEQRTAVFAHGELVAPIKVEDARTMMRSVNTSDNSSFLASAVRAAGVPLLIFEALAFLPCNLNGGSLEERVDVSALDPFRLEAFRFFGVAHIVLFHHGMARALEGAWRNFCSAGRYWVQFFFALSGYIEFFHQRGQTQVLHCRDNLLRRLARAYPMYLIGTLFGLLASSEPVGTTTLEYVRANAAPGFLMMDSWLCPYGTQNPDGPAWFLCTLFAFWLCFPRWYDIVRNCGCPVILCGCVWLSSCALPLTLAHTTNFASFHPLANWPSFVFGMCLARLAPVASGAQKLFVLSRFGSCGAFVLLLALFVTLPPENAVVWSMWLDKGPLLLPLFGLILFFVPFGVDVAFGHKCFTSPIVMWLGRLSFSLFILHWPVHMMVQKWIPGTSMSLELLAQFGAAVIFKKLEDAAWYAKRPSCEVKSSVLQASAA